MSFTDVSPSLRVEIGDYALDLSWIGEGWEGDYNEDDPDDEPLLRFDAWKRRDPEDLGDYDRWGRSDWTEIPDSSYCTRLPATSKAQDLIPLAGLMLLRIIDADGSGTVKRTCEELSWVGLEDLTGAMICGKVNP